jgi:large subunit ribosomal protein L22
MQIIATQKFIRMSPRKLRVVVPMISDLSPAGAVEKLPYAGKRAAEPLMKVIKTAIANAKQKGLSEADLIFKEIQINEGPRLKRYRAGARGRVKPYKRRMSHIRVVLESKPRESSKKSSKGSKRTTPKAKTQRGKTDIKSTKSIKGKLLKSKKETNKLKR